MNNHTVVCKGDYQLWWVQRTLYNFIVHLKKPIRVIDPPCDFDKVGATSSLHGYASNYQLLTRCGDPTITQTIVSILISKRTTPDPPASHLQIYDANKKFSSDVDPVRPDGSSEATPAPAPEEEDGDDGDDPEWDDQFYNSVDDEVRDTFQYQAGGRFVGFGTNKAGQPDDMVDDNPYGEND